MQADFIFLGSDLSFLKEPALSWRQSWSSPEEGKAAHAEIPLSCEGVRDQLGPRASAEQEGDCGRRQAGTLSQQILHLGTRAVIMDNHIKTQVSETLEKGLGIFVRSVSDVHTCGKQAPSPR